MRKRHAFDDDNNLLAMHYLSTALAVKSNKLFSKIGAMVSLVKPADRYARDIRHSIYPRRIVGNYICFYD